MYLLLSDLRIEIESQDKCHCVVSTTAHAQSDTPLMELPLPRRCLFENCWENDGVRVTAVE